jgi:hypothetical protein
MNEIRKSVSEFREMAVNACRLVSMDPERMGNNICIECSNELAEFLAQIPEELRDDYEAKYLHKWREWLAALSRCYSVLVVGPARFNTRRHAKMNDYERAAKQRLQDWCEKVVKRINRQERLTGWQEVERLQNKLDTLTEWHEQMKAANRIIKSKSTADEQREELAAIGLGKREIAEVMGEVYPWKGYSAASLSNNLAKIKATQAAIERHKAMAEAEDKEITFNGGRVVVCNADERMRFYFEEMPSAEVRALMKRKAFKWSPKNGAWQRQLTPNCKYDTKRILAELNK